MIILIGTYLIHGLTHRVRDLVSQRLIFEIVFDVMRSITHVRYKEEALDCALRDGFDLLRLAEFDFIAPNVTLLIVEEDLVGEHVRPAVDHLLHDVLSTCFVHFTLQLLIVSFYNSNC